MDKLYTDIGWEVGFAKLDTHPNTLFHKSTQIIIYYRELQHQTLHVNLLLNELFIDILTDIMYWLSFTNVLDVHKSAQNRATFNTEYFRH